MTLNEQKRQAVFYSKENGQAVEIQVRYEIGGINYFMGNKTARGYYLSITPIKINNYNRYTTKEYSAFTGIKKLLKATKSYNKNTLIKLVKEYEPLCSKITKVFEAKHNPSQARQPELMEELINIK